MWLIPHNSAERPSFFYKHFVPTARSPRSNMNTKRSPEQLRSHRWFSGESLRAFTHRSRAKQMGYALDDFAGKPVIGIINTWSDSHDLSQSLSHARRRS